MLTDSHSCAILTHDERVDYLKIRRRIWLKRTIFSILAVLAVLAGIYIFETNSDVPVKEIRTSVSSSKSKEIEQNQWQQIIQALDNKRATAIINRDVSQLEAIYVKPSLLRIEDEKLIKQLIETDSQVQNLHFQILKVELKSHRWSNREEVVELQVQDRRSEYYLKSGEQRKLISARGTKTWVISIEKVGESWLIRNAQALLDDG